MTDVRNRPFNSKHDPRAVRVADSLRKAIDAECVILFGSRARGDWTDRSDLDLMIINPALPDQAAASNVQSIAHRLMEQNYSQFMDADFVYMTPEEYARKSLHSINSVARMAFREGIKMPRDPENYQESYNEEGNDYSEEYAERNLRISHANTHYDGMHVLMDIGRENLLTAYNAHQSLEHGMKALISALGYEYPHTHRLDLLAEEICRRDPEREWRFASNFETMNNYAGGSRYGPLLTPIADYRQMANSVTEDLGRVYRRIEELTGEDPWNIPPEGSTDTVSPRQR